MLNVVSVCVGEKYGPDYLAIWHNQVARNLSTQDHAHWCITDRPDIVPEGVNVIEADPTLPGWWQKVNLFNPAMPWKAGDRVLFMDLDICVTGRLEDFPKGICRDDLWQGCYNSSVMCWDHGEHAHIYLKFDRDKIDRPGPLGLEGGLPKGQVNGGDQEWITHISVWPVFPEGMCSPFKRLSRDWPPAEARVVYFNGNPKPHDIKDGWVPNVWRLNGWTSLPEMRGVNVDNSYLWANIETNVQRDLPWFSGFGEQTRAVAIVCGGPSLKDSLPSIRDQKRRGTKIATVNNAMRFLLENGIVPDAHVILDARPENAAFVTNAPKQVRYFLASQCHPSTFDALEGHDVVLWHNLFGDNEKMRSVLEPWWEGPNAKPIVGIPGGGTVGLRALWLCERSGYKTIHVYGMDSCYHDDVHHAYPQPLNDGEDLLELKMGGKTYHCARWMARQAEEFRETWTDLHGLGVTVHVHGKGLIPDMARTLRDERRAA